MACIFPTDHVEANASDCVFGFGVLTCSGLNLIYLNDAIRRAER